MKSAKFLLSALGAAIALYVIGFIVLGFFHEPKCRPISEHWWGALSRCEIVVPMR